MTIITISRSFCSKGSIIAERIADQLGFECVSREILIEASEQFNIPEIKLARAIHDSPSIFERLTHGKEKYISFIRAALLKRLKKGNIVYHGLAGHFFLQNIPGILKVRTLSDFEDRVKEEMERENITETLARKQLTSDDRQRLNWSFYMYKMDPSDPELYDMILNLKHIPVDECVSLIINAASLDTFKISDQGKAILEDEALAATVKAAIVDKYYNARVRSISGTVSVSIDETVSDIEKTKAVIENAVTGIEGIKNLNIDLISSALSHTVMRK